MASCPENVRPDLDNATTDTTASSLPPPPYSHLPHLPPPAPAHPQGPLPAYPSAPPPDYGQIVGNKGYEASNATGPYLYTTIQPHQQMLLLPPYSPVAAASNGHQPQQQLVLIPDSSALRSGPQSHGQPSFLAHLVFSCCVFWCCGWMCGGIAFIVALIAQNSAASGDVAGARRLGYLSLALSICGFIIGTIVTIVVVVQASQN